MLSRGTKSKNNKKIRRLKIYPPVKLEQLSVIFILKYINNVIGQKYMTSLVPKKCQG